MKMNIKVLIMLLLLCSYVYAQNNTYYYWYNGEKYDLHLNNQKNFLLLKDNINKNNLSADLNIEVSRIDSIIKVNVGASLIPHKHQDMEENSSYWTVVSTEGKSIDYSSKNISYHSPFFYSNSGKELGLSHLFYVKLRKEEDIILLEGLAEVNKVKLLGNNKYMPLWYILSCSHNSKGNALEMANMFFETKLFASSQPDLMEDDLIQTVDDRFYTSQWNLNNTGQNGGTTGVVLP